ncbi:hypothetical protein BGX21_003895, partial [Mortierella sp. AD011]
MSSPQIQWLLAKEGNKEHVDFSTFVKKFRYRDKQSATDAYLALIRSSAIRQYRQKRLLEAFISFQKNNEEDFWSTRALQLNSQITSKKAAVYVQDVGLRQAESAYNHCSLQINVNAAPIKSASVPDPDVD